MISRLFPETKDQTPNKQQWQERLQEEKQEVTLSRTSHIWGDPYMTLLPSSYIVNYYEQ